MTGIQLKDLWFEMIEQGSWYEHTYAVTELEKYNYYALTVGAPFCLKTSQESAVANLTETYISFLQARGKDRGYFNISHGYVAEIGLGESLLRQFQADAESYMLEEAKVPTQMTV